VNEAKWLECEQPDEMLAFARGQAALGLRALAAALVGREPAYRATRRQIRLFCCACCRRLWPLLDEARRWAVEVTERFVDGQALAQDMAAAHARVVEALTRMTSNDAAFHAARAVEALLIWGSRTRTRWAAERSQNQVLYSAGHALAAGSGLEAEQAAQCWLLREVLGNPFRPVSLTPEVRAWGEQTVVRVALAIHQERDFERMPILADALEEAGCAEERIISHCRSGREHVRGCWALELCLGWDGQPALRG
jgi:hypothetical protein